MKPATFKTFRPVDATVARYVDYYYLDRKPGNVVNTFDCFPHYNNTISLYATHRMPGVGQITYDPLAPPLQIFTPLRDSVLRVTQTGPVHRVVIVFHVLGVQHFWPNRSFADYEVDHSFFSAEELHRLFATDDVESLTDQLDYSLRQRFAPRPVDMVTSILSYIFDHLQDFSVGKMADSLGNSRRHLQRMFKATIGVSIKQFHQIVVLRSVIDNRLSDTVDDNFTQLAYRANFSDQAHMIRVFRKLTQNAPRQFFEKGQVLGQADTFWHQVE